MKAKILGNWNKEMRSGDIVTVYPDNTADGIDIFEIPIGRCYLCEKNGVKSYIPVSHIKFKNEEQDTFLPVSSEKNIDWEQRRYNLAKSVLINILSNPTWDKVSDLNYYKSEIIGSAISYDDEMIEKLKNNEDGKE